MKILVVIPQSWGAHALNAALGAAQQVAGETGFSVLLTGDQTSAQDADLACQAGAGTLYQAVHPGLAEQEDPLILAPAIAEALQAIMRSDNGSVLVLLPPDAQGEQLAALLADLLDGEALGRCSDLRFEGDAILAERAAWGGRMRITLRVEGRLAFACLRAGRAVFKDFATTDLHRLDLHGDLPRALPVEKRESAQRLPPLEGAKLVVSGGRGVNEQGFKLLEDLASRLNGTLGGSLPAVDAGMVPVLRQVGVSGKFVSPDVYVAVGISGTLQHLAGVSLDSRIVAINQDPDADIFKVATLGIVASWETLIPALLDALGEQGRRQSGC